MWLRTLTAEVRDDLPAETADRQEGPADDRSRRQDPGPWGQGVQGWPSVGRTFTCRVGKTKAEEVEGDGEKVTARRRPCGVSGTGMWLGLLGLPEQSCTPGGSD